VSIDNPLASVAVNSLLSAVKWCESVLRRPPPRPMPEVTAWGFERGGSLQVHQLPERAGAWSFTLILSYLEEQAQYVRTLNIDVSAKTNGERVKTRMITDPDRNHIAFAEPVVPLSAEEDDLRSRRTCINSV
jgi:hypothetical protein